MKQPLLVLSSIISLLIAADTVSSEQRLWKDSSGKFEVMAEFVDLSETHVRLRKSDGTTVTVPLDKLCAEDRKFLDRRKKDAGPVEELTGVELALRQPASINAQNTPLREVIRQLNAQHKINLIADPYALASTGIQIDTPITYQARDQSLEDVLRAMLLPLQLDAFPVGNEFVVITDGKRLMVETHTYRAKQPAEMDDLQALQRQITSQVSPGGWSQVGGIGSCIVFPYPAPFLVVQHTYWAHREIEERFAGQLQRVQVRHRSVPSGLRLPEVLFKPCTVAVKVMRLSEFITYLNNSFGLACEIDPGAMPDAGRDDGIPLTGTFTEVQLLTVLDRILRTSGRAWTVKDDGTVMITTPQAAAERLISVDYRVGPLTYSANNPASRSMPDYDALLAAIMICVEPTGWRSVGGRASIRHPTTREGQGTITVQHNLHGHLAVSEFLDQLRAANR